MYYALYGLLAAFIENGRNFCGVASTGPAINKGSPIKKLPAGIMV